MMTNFEMCSVSVDIVTTQWHVFSFSIWFIFRFGSYKMKKVGYIYILNRLIDKSSLNLAHFFAMYSLQQKKERIQARPNVRASA